MQNHALPGVDGNDIHRTNVCNARILYREEAYRRELNLIALAIERPVTAPRSPFPIPNPTVDGKWRCDPVALQELNNIVMPKEASSVPPLKTD